MSVRPLSRIVLPRRRACGWLAAGMAAHWIGACSHMAPAEKTTALEFSIDADDEINTNEKNEPSPVIVRIYELKALTAFKQASFFELLDNDTGRLGTELVAKREFEIKPGEKQAFTRDSPEATKHLGVIAGFRQIASSEWRASADLAAEGDNAFLIKINATTVTLQLKRTPRKLGIF